MAGYWKCRKCGSAKPISKFPTPKTFLRTHGSTFVTKCLKCIWHEPEAVERRCAPIRARIKATGTATAYDLNQLTGSGEGIAP